MSKRNSPNKKAQIQQADRACQQALALMQTGRTQESANLLQQLLKVQPQHADALYLFGVIHAQSGHLPQAAELLQRSVAANRKNTEALLTLGNILNAQKKFADAQAVFTRALKLKPNFPEAHNGLGISLSGEKHHQEAIKHYETALRQRPKFVEAMTNCGLAALELEDYPGAISKLTSALELAPESVALVKSLGLAYQHNQEPDNSLRYLKRAVELIPNDLDTLLALAFAATTFKAFDDARDTLARVNEQFPNAPLGYTYLGNLNLEEGNLEAALESFQLAAEKGADPAKISHQKGRAYAQFGQFSEAAACYLAALELDPTLASVVRDLVMISTNLDVELLATRFAPLLESEAISSKEKSKLSYAMGKACDDARLYPQAFDHYSRGNKLKQQRFDREAFSDQVEQLINFFTPAFFQRWGEDGSSSERPLFIVGMPRSGTSLTEQILASHPAIVGGGEQIYWSGLTRSLCNKFKLAGAFPACLSTLNPQHIVRMIRDYDLHLDTLSSDARYVADKMPSNFLRLGLIGLLYPRARIIHCKRDPMDNCLSAFFQDFSATHAYSSDLEDLGFYYQQYQRLMEHWEAVIPNPVKPLHYEELVADQESVTRELVAFLGLEWDEQCLEYYKSDRAVKTASIWQARQPIYATSVERWRNYSTELEPLRKALGLP